MIRRSLALFLLGVAAGSAAYSQQTPEPKKDKETPGVQSFAWGFDGDGAYLGVQTADVTKENFGKYGLRDVRGVIVEKVMENSPAAEAGIQSGDVVIRFNGEEISSVRKLTRLISEVAPDHQARITVLRNGRESEFTVTLAKRPAPKFEMGNFDFDMPVAPGNIPTPNFPGIPKVPDWKEFPKVAPGAEGDTFYWRSGSSRQIGVSISPVTKQLGDYFGVAEGTLLISNVRDNSPASKAGLKAGDVIIEIDGKPIGSDVDLVRALGSKKDGDVELTIIRNKNRQTVRVTPETVKGNLTPFFDSSEGIAPVGPGEFRLAVPRAPAMLAVPPVAPSHPVPMTLFRHGPRIL